MSTIADLETELNKLKAQAITGLPKASGWLSRKLWVFLIVISVLLFMGRDNFIAIVWGIIGLAALYLVSQTVHDICSDRNALELEREKFDLEKARLVAAAQASAVPTVSPLAPVAKS